MSIVSISSWITNSLGLKYTELSRLVFLAIFCSEITLDLIINKSKDGVSQITLVTDVELVLYKYAILSGNVLWNISIIG